jgi:hypothetical protein
MGDRFTNGWNGNHHQGKRFGTLWSEKGDIDGDVTIAPCFDDLSDVAKHDLLDDWIGLLEKERAELHKKMYGK